MPSIFRSHRLPYISLVGLAIVILAIFGALQLNQNQRQASQWVTHTLQVELQLNQILFEAARIETNHRGFLLFGDRVSQDRFNEAIRKATQLADTLIAKVRDNPEQRANAIILKRLILAKEDFAQANLALARAGQRDRAIDLLGKGEGSRIVAAIRNQSRKMIAIEARLFEDRNHNAQQLIGSLSFGLALVVGLVVLVALAIMVDARRRFAALNRALHEAETAEEAARAEIAAREVAESRMRQMQKMESIGQLTGGIAHDFNNMLAIIIGSLDLAERRIRSDPDRAIQSINSAREGADRAATLTARLLAFSRQQPLAPVAIAVNKMVSSMSEMLRRTLGETIEVETVLAGGLWSTFADSGQLENAILNLAVNARDAMPEGGRLTIETANSYLDDDYAVTREDVKPGQYVMIGVSDTGAGMDADTIGRAFDPFFTTKEVGKGTGLGLSQVFGFVKQSGGHIAIYSEPGEGTTVKLYLPRYRGIVPETRPVVMAEDLPIGRADELILVVEDEQRVRHFSVDALRELGYSVISATDGIQALDLIRAHPGLALLFTDVVMPRMDGRKLSDAAHKINASLKVLYTTGYTRNAVVHNGTLDAGVAFLSKPFTMEQLARKVRAVLDGEGINRAE